LRQYRNHHCLLEKEGWKCQIKAQYQIRVIAKDRTEYICDLSFGEFTKAETFLQDFLVYESSEEWVTSNEMIFSPINPQDT
jgi:hypothetical protein